MDPRRLTTPDARRRRTRRGPRRDPLRARRAGPADPAGDDGRRRDAGVQLPGPVAAARPLHLRRRRRRLYRARRRDGGRLGRRRARHRRPRPGLGAADRRLRGRLRPLLAARRGGPQPAARSDRARPARRGERHLRRRRQLDPAARRQPRDARAGDGALLGRLPRLDPDRRRRSSAALAELAGPRAGLVLAGIAALAAGTGGCDRLRAPTRPRVQRPRFDYPA